MSDGPDYGMFTNDGNDRVDAIVDDVCAQAKANGWGVSHTVDVIHGCLDELADEPSLEEAYDTTVRDAVAVEVELRLSANDPQPRGARR